LTHLLGPSPGETLGLAPSVIVAAAQASRIYASDHWGFFLEVLRMLISFWPLLLVIVGAGFLKDVFTDEVDTFTAPVEIFPGQRCGTSILLLVVRSIDRPGIIRPVRDLRNIGHPIKTKQN
jgi:hypothetical protein